MGKKMIISSFIFWMIASVASTNPAEATVAITGLEDVERVVATPLYHYEETVVYCGDDKFPVHLSYLQLVAIVGFGKMWAPVEAPYATGPKDASPQAVECEDEDGEKVYLYELGGCAC